jgi:hypothetical protein
MKRSSLEEPRVRDATANKLLALLAPIDFGRIAMELERFESLFGKYCISRESR